MSTLAKTTTATGRDKGKTISAAASVNGKSHANDQAATNGAAKTSSTSDNHGSQISTLATTTTAKGVDKGAEISTAASDGKNKAGQNGKAGDDHGKSQDDHGNPTQPSPPANRNKAATGANGNFVYRSQDGTFMAWCHDLTSVQRRDPFDPDVGILHKLRVTYTCTDQDRNTVYLKAKVADHGEGAAPVTPPPTSSDSPADTPTDTETSPAETPEEEPNDEAEPWWRKILG